MTRIASVSLVFLLAAPLFSQSISSGTVTGSVLDPDKMVIPKAQVELRNQVTAFSQSTMTDETGAFRFNNVPPAMYEIVVTATGFSSQQRAAGGEQPGSHQLDIHSPDGRGDHHGGRRRIPFLDRHRSFRSHGLQLSGVHETTVLRSGIRFEQHHQ